MRRNSTSKEFVIWVDKFLDKTIMAYLESHSLEEVLIHLLIFLMILGLIMTILERRGNDGKD